MCVWGVIQGCASVGVISVWGIGDPVCIWLFDVLGDGCALPGTGSFIGCHPNLGASSDPLERTCASGCVQIRGRCLLWFVEEGDYYRFYREILSLSRMC